LGKRGNIGEIAIQVAQMSRINRLEGTTGFHLEVDGSLSVTNLQKFGDTMGAGASVRVGTGDKFTLNGAGNFVDSQGGVLTQDKTGAFHIQGPSA
jgi:hypothetical protein